jgi:hypothetical protein
MDPAQVLAQQQQQQQQIKVKHEVISHELPKDEFVKPEPKKGKQKQKDNGHSSLLHVSYFT